MGALVGIESVSPQGLNDVHKSFNVDGDQLIERLRGFREQGVHVLGSFIFGLASDRDDTFDATVAVAQRAGVTFAQFVMLTPFPGTTDFVAREKSMARDETRIAGVPLTRHWLIPQGQRPKVYTPHPTMAADQIRPWHTARVGPVLRSRQRLGAVALRLVVEIAPGLRGRVEAVPADVRQYRHRHR